MSSTRFLPDLLHMTNSHGDIHILALGDDLSSSVSCQRVFCHQGVERCLLPVFGRAFVTSHTRPGYLGHVLQGR